MTVNGEAVGPPTLGQFGVLFGIVLAIAFLIQAFLSAERLGHNGGAA